ncbi:unnamed protein product [Oppiella nova]|uniref:Uncharacterized protein n=1 Tax=Oppiella nova TaxID=334625 RepID=A0A7R9MIS7_9ACAR|nr:unnamed protein product [Oppiella nova]CAG2178150.1 unnamed protein product [Oppiella nova]
MLSKTTLGVAAGVGAFLVYCVYFDRKRRSDPDFKVKLRESDIEPGIDHLSNAVAVCGQPQQLLQVLQQTLPPQVFHLLLQRLPIVSQKISKMENKTGGIVEPGHNVQALEAMAEEDVE